MTKPNRTFTKNMATLGTGVVGEDFIRSMKKILNANARRHMYVSVSSTAPNVTPDEEQTLRDRIANTLPRIEPKQEAKGLEWLRDKRRKKDLGTRELAILADFSHFTLAGFYSESGLQYVPVYNVHAKDGRAFTYRYGSWQSGTKLEIVG